MTEFCINLQIYSFGRLSENVQYRQWETFKIKQYYKKDSAEWFYNGFIKNLKHLQKKVFDMKTQEVVLLFHVYM